MNNYTILHCHSDMSNGITNIDSVTKYQDYVTRAQECGMQALAFSEHGSVFAWDLKKEAIEAAGMKYIHAEEFYVTESLTKRIRDNWHCLLIAKNYDGVKELNRLATGSFNRQDGHFYYVPRITFDELLGTSDNIIITSACLGGILNHASDETQRKFLQFMSVHKDRCFLEIQHHQVPDQVIYNQKLYQLSQVSGIRLVAGTDTHALNADHLEGRKILQRAKDIVFADEDGWDLKFKTYEELVDSYKRQDSLPEAVYMEAIENTNVIADMIEPFVLDRKTKYPHIYDDPIKTFKQKINEGYKNNQYLHERYNKEEVFSRIKEEFAVYEKVGAIDFMLLESYIREWEKENGIQSGYGRGSVSGSLIAYILGITQMDSLKFDLNFFRFMNPARVTNADIDTDYCSVDRDKIKYFLLHDKMNLPNIKTSEIITFNTIATKGAVRDVCRALYKKNDNEYLKIADYISNGVDDNEETMRKEYPEVFKYVDIVSGTIVSIGSHPSGVLVSDREIESEVGLCSIATSDYPVSMLDMHGLDGQMFVKLDILGLDNIGVINQACKLAQIERLTPDNVDLNDEKVWRSIRDDTTLIFQWESSSAQAYLKKFMSDETIRKVKARMSNFSYLKWFSFGNGLLRPACASYRDEVSGGDFYDNGFKELNEFLAPEAGRVCMQETIMMFLVKFCGYTQAESDSVRRAIAKKKGTATLLPEIEERFVNYSSTHYDITKEKCQEVIKPFLQIILDASSYGFSWNHSDAYSAIGYVSGYLRYYYPLEFLTAAFNIFTGKEEKITAITQYATKIGVKIHNIRFGYSKAEYNLDKETKTIYKGMESIKYMSADTANKLYEMSQTKTYNSFIELLEEFPGDSRQLHILVSLGYFCDFGTPGQLISLIRRYIIWNNRKVLSKDLSGLPTPETMSQFATETAKQYKLTDPQGFLSYMCSNVEPTPFTLSDELNAQIEFQGYCSTKIPSKRNWAYITAVDTKYSPKITIYCLDTGVTKTVKMYKKQYQMNPVEKGMIITYGLTSKQKSRLNPETKEWQKIPGEYEDFFDWYSIREGA